MRAEEIGGAPHLLLYTLSLLYGAGVCARRLSYKLGILPFHNLPAKVVSVGNLTAGGTGKTPVTIFLAEFFRNDGKRVAVLSRGYRGRARGASVVSDGKAVLMGPLDAGDEPYLMAARLPGVPVIVCPDRVKGGRLAIERFSPHVLVLDDAFQHVRLERDVNILVLDSKEGFGNGYMLPRGMLREPVSALRRADFALVKGGPPEGRALEALRKYSIPYLPFTYRPASAYNVDSGKGAPLDALRGRKVASVAGIANPASFNRTLAELGCTVTAALEFPDHHRYTESDARAIEGVAAGAEMIITTEKDGVKLKGLVRSVPLLALSIAVEVEKGRLSSSLAQLLRGGG